MLAALRIKSGITPLPPRVWLPGGWLGLPGQASHLLNYTTLLGRICESVFISVRLFLKSISC